LAECEVPAESQEETRGELGVLVRQAQTKAKEQGLAVQSDARLG
jgi:hypothetical protein